MYQILSELTSVHGSSVYDAVLSGRARGAIWRGYDDDYWTAGCLQTGGRLRTGNVSLVELPKEIAHSWHSREAPGSIRRYTQLSGFSLLNNLTLVVPTPL